MCACVCVCTANSNKSSGLWITSSSDNYLSTSQFKVSFTNPFTFQQICFSQVCLEERADILIYVYNALAVFVSYAVIYVVFLMAYGIKYFSWEEQ